MMADLVQTHSNTIPTLAQGFLECKKYITPAETTRFLDQHLRARIGTRLLAEQHIALHATSTLAARKQPADSHHIGVIDTALRPADVISSCEHWVGEICELKYGIRPQVIINGEVDAEFAHVPMHLEYILTELLKNAFRATIESDDDAKPIEITIAAAQNAPISKLEALRNIEFHENHTHDFSPEGLTEYCTDFETAEGPLNTQAQHITIRIRDNGGGIPPEILPQIWGYSFTTFDAHQSSSASRSDDVMMDGLDAIANGGNSSSIAGLGYGLPLGRAYAEYFGGSVSVQSMYGWGTDVYLSLQGIGKIL